MGIEDALVELVEEVSVHVLVFWHVVIESGRTMAANEAVRLDKSEEENMVVQAETLSSEGSHLDCRTVASFRRLAPSWLYIFTITRGSGEVVPRRGEACKTDTG